MNGLLDAKKCGWPYPHGERREVMIATLRWAIVCRLFPMVSAFMQAGEGRRAENLKGGKFYSWRRASERL